MNHPLLSTYPTKTPYDDGTFWHTFLGVKIRKAFVSVPDDFGGMPGYDISIPATTDDHWRATGEEIFEIIDLAETAATARDTYTVMDLGAGYGRWLTHAEMFRRAFNPSVTGHYIGIEGDRTHWQWMIQHFTDNGLSPYEHNLCCGVVSAKPYVWFMKNDAPAEWYGQGIRRSLDLRVPASLRRGVSLKRLLESYKKIDLLDADLQGIELEVFTQSIKALNEKVARVHIGTHSPEIETGLRYLFGSNHWIPHFDFPGMGTRDTPHGPVSFQDGAQSWINPRLKG